MTLTCPNYSCISCIDGSCPIACSEEYAEYGLPVVRTCIECPYYHGCDNCDKYVCNDVLKYLYCKK